MNLTQVEEGEIYGIHRKDGLDDWNYRHLSVPAEVLALQPDQADFDRELDGENHIIRWGNGSGPTVLAKLRGVGVSSPVAGIGSPMLLHSNHIRLHVSDMVDPKVLCPPTDKVYGKM